MFKFEVQNVSVTDQAVHLAGVWDLGGTKRFQILRVPVDLFVADGPLEALCEIHQDRARKVAETAHADEQWEQFLLFG